MPRQRVVVLGGVFVGDGSWVVGRGSWGFGEEFVIGSLGSWESIWGNRAVTPGKPGAICEGVGGMGAVCAVGMVPSPVFGLKIGFDEGI
jgi:hypothetical protein